MPITKSAKKALRQSIKRRKKNLFEKKKLKDLLKKVDKLVSSGKIDEAKKAIPQVYKTMDKATKAGMIKKNAASRKKSRITRAIAKVKP